MAVSPLVLVQEGAGPFNQPSPGGLDVGAGAAISIKLDDITGVVDWFLQVIGTDELSTNPVMTGVNGITNKVNTPSTVVTLTFPAGTGRAVGFKSTVTGVGGPVEVEFGLYSLTAFTTRVGFVGEKREGDASFGWATKLNPLIRSGGGGGGGPDNFSWKTVPTGQTVTIPENQQMAVTGGLDLDGTLELEGELILHEF